MNKEPVKITSRLRKEFSKKINLAGEEYLVDSEESWNKKPSYDNPDIS